jgi:hypothetical protein
MHPQVEGIKLAFQLKRIDGSSAPMDFTVERTYAATARIHCLNCGDNAPVIEMSKED